MYFCRVQYDHTFIRYFVCTFRGFDFLLSNYTWLLGIYSGLNMDNEHWASLRGVYALNCFPRPPYQCIPWSSMWRALQVQRCYSYSPWVIARGETVAVCKYTTNLVIVYQVYIYICITEMQARKTILFKQD